LVAAIQRSYLLLSDSGGLQEEAPSLGKPVLVLRDTTERPEAVMGGTAKLVGTTVEGIVAAASNLLGNSAAYQAMANAINPFGDGTASVQILRVVEKFLDENKK
jgi:UDP-N-acetylglucosamine 2-epimerase (non-hydrolysing)